MVVVQVTTDNREPFRQYDSPTPWFGTAPEALLQGFATLPEVEVHVIGCTQQPMKSSPEKLAPNIWFHSLHVPKLGWLRTGYSGCIRAVRRKIREIRPDIVHGQGTERECALSAVFSGWPNVVTIHGNMAAMARSDQPLLGKLHAHCAAFFEGIALSRTTGVFCNSEYTERLVRAHTPHTWSVPNAVRLRFLEVPFGTTRDHRPTLLNIGNILPWKGQIELLDLAQELHNQGCDFVLRFVGGLNVETSYGRRFAVKMEAAQNLGYAEYLGAQNLERLIQTLDSASGLIHLAKEEAFGLVVAEALSRNLKLFAMRVGGVPDIASGIEGAELFHPSARPELVECIQRWLSAGAPRPIQAASVMRTRYHPEIVARKHLEIYQKILTSIR